MQKLTLTRDAKQPAPADCTLGVLTFGVLALHTIERPWIPDEVGECGRPGASCIQTGVYTLTPRTTEARGAHWILSNPTLSLWCYPSQVPAGCYGRSLVLIHAANWAHELMGCIAPGLDRRLDPQNGWMVTQSQLAMSLLRRALLSFDTGELTIS